MFFKKYPQNLKYNVTTEDLGRGVGRVFSYWAKSVESGKSYLSTLPKLLYIYLFFEAIIVLKCNDFPRLLKTHFFYLFCKYFAAISVASSVNLQLPALFIVGRDIKIMLNILNILNNRRGWGKGWGVTHQMSAEDSSLLW